MYNYAVKVLDSNGFFLWNGLVTTFEPYKPGDRFPCNNIIYEIVFQL